MKFKIDENLPLALAHHLRLIGHDADTVSDENLAGAPDSLVVPAALREQRVVLTLDKGIADLTQYPSSTHAGVVLFRPGMSDRMNVLRFVTSRLDETSGARTLWSRNHRFGTKDSRSLRPERVVTSQTILSTRRQGWEHDESRVRFQTSAAGLLPQEWN